MTFPSPTSSHLLGTAQILHQRNAILSTKIDEFNMLYMAVEEHALALWIDTTVGIGQVLH